MKSQAGMSLLEVLLSVALGALIVMGAMQVAQDWAERSRNRDEAAYLMRVQSAAKAYVAMNFGKIMEDGFNENMGDTNEDGVFDNNDLINVNRSIRIPMRRGAGDFYLVGSTGGLPEEFPVTTPLGRNVDVYVRNTGFIGDQRMVAVFTVTTLDTTANKRPISEINVRDIAQSIGPEAGVYKTSSTCQAGVLESVYGGWTLNNTAFSSGRMMNGSSAYCPPSGEGFETYVALRDRVSYESGLTSYLYRVAVPGAPQLNRMETNLDMNGYDVKSVATLHVDNLQVHGAARIRGVESSAALFVDQNLRVSGNNSTVRGQSGVSAGGSPRILSGGNVIARNASVDTLNQHGAAAVTVNAPLVDVQRKLAVGDSIAVGQTMTVDDTVKAEQVAATTAVIRQGGGAASQASPLISNLNVIAPAQFSRIDAGKLTASTLSVGDTLKVSNDLITTGNLSFDSSSSLNGGLTASQFQLIRLNTCWATTKYRPGGQKISSGRYNCKDGPNQEEDIIR